MSSDILEERAKQIEEIDCFTEMITKELTDITAALGWTVESITDNNEETITCPYDSSHRICERTSDKHLIKCQWKAEGYSEQDVPLSEPSLPPGAPSSICFDENLQDTVLKAAKEKNPSMKTGMGERLIPRTSDRLITDFTKDERVALYDYVIANTTKPDLGHDIPDINKPKTQENEDKEISFLELLAQERNLKRRRAKHRGVHTNKKSHTEILREVIDQQMEMYTDYISEQNQAQSNCASSREKSLTEDKEYTSDSLELNENSRSKYSEYVPEEGNGHYSLSHRDKQNHWGYTRKTEDYESRKRKWRDSSPRVKEKSTDYKRSEYKHNSSSKDRKKSHKDRRRSEDRHIKKKHKSQDRDSSSERRHSKHKHRSKKSRRS